jgi:hypothetical protein
MSEKPISPLRRRMIEDMTVRNFVEKTHNDYSWIISNNADRAPAGSGHAHAVRVYHLRDPGRHQPEFHDDQPGAISSRTTSPGARTDRLQSPFHNDLDAGGIDTESDAQAALGLRDRQAPRNLAQEGQLKRLTGWVSGTGARPLLAHAHLC